MPCHMRPGGANVKGCKIPWHASPRHRLYCVETGQARSRRTTNEADHHGSSGRNAALAGCSGGGDADANSDGEITAKEVAKQAKAEGGGSRPNPASTRP